MKILFKNIILKNPSRHIFSILMGVTFFLLMMHLVTHYFPDFFPQLVTDRFNLDMEANVPTWYATILFFSVSFASLLLYSINSLSEKDYSHWRFFWLIFGLVFCYLSIDEAARLHEIIDLTIPLKWVIVYAPFLLAFFIFSAFYFIKIKTDNNNTRNWILTGLCIMAIGGMGAEMISYMFGPLPPDIQQAEFVIEEGGEMTGLIFVFTGCLSEIQSICAGKFTKEEKSI